MTNNTRGNNFRHIKRAGRIIAEKAIIRPLAKALGISLLDCAHRQMGISGHTTGADGESYLLVKVLPYLLANTEPLIFDVGANIGDYTRIILRQFPKASVYAFEPAPGNFSVLLQNVPDEQIRCIPMGLGDRQEMMNIYDYAGETGSQHASLYRAVFSDFHKAQAISENPVTITTLDDFCNAQQMMHLDFLKIDTEGNELAVLRGGTRLIATGGLPIIQFEFNEMNVASRCFLKDFYEILQGYDFYRLTNFGLLRLKGYHPRNEIFRFQNILALRTADVPPERVRQFIRRVR